MILTTWTSLYIICLEEQKKQNLLKWKSVCHDKKMKGKLTTKKTRTSKDKIVEFMSMVINYKPASSVSSQIYPNTHTHTKNI